MEYALTFERYLKGLEQGKFLGLRCKKCRAVTFPPLGVCRDCKGTELERCELGGEGVIRTFTVIRVAPEGRKPPYVVAMAALDEGPWVLGNLEGVNPDEADMGLIGKRVRLGRRSVKGDAYSGGDAQVIAFDLIG